MEKSSHMNREGTEFTFTDQPNGNILWEGPFDYCRISYPNDYSTAYNKYVYNKGTLSFNEFKERAHDYDVKKKQYVMGMDVVSLITPMPHIINMVDPSGGPYLAAGAIIHNKVIKEFFRVPTGYEIVVEHENKSTE